jgi:DNA-binding NarL/FixJ family response regulator
MDHITKNTLTFTRDEQGKELLLKEGKFQVMMEWEKPYMEACIDALEPFGDVLEIGFGCGYSATRIQSYHTKSHTIIECDPLVAEKARQFAEKHPHVTIIENTWQDALASLGVFDIIFFDDYVLETEAEMQAMQQKAVMSHAVLENGRQVLEGLQAVIAPHLPKSYRDEDLLEFVQLMISNGDVEPKHLLSFLEDLKLDKQITVTQKQLAIDLSLAKGLMTPADLVSFNSQREGSGRSFFSFKETGDRLFEFLSLALQKHMRKGSRFSCFLEDPTSKFENKKFFDHIITNPYLHYTEKWIDIDVPENCQYYKGTTALVITITKMQDDTTCD